MKIFTISMFMLLHFVCRLPVYGQFSVRYAPTDAKKANKIAVGSKQKDAEPFTLSTVPAAIDISVGKLQFFKVKTPADSAIGFTQQPEGVANRQVVLEDFGSFYNKTGPFVLKIANTKGVVGLYEIGNQAGGTGEAGNGTTAAGTGSGGTGNAGTGSGASGANHGRPVSTGAQNTEEDYEKAVNDYMDQHNLTVDGVLNQIRKGNEVHIFMNTAGETLVADVPTTGREDQRFIFHIVHEAGDNLKFRLDAKGVYKPKVVVYDPRYNTEESAPVADEGTKPVLEVITLKAVGPFTGSFTAKIKRKDNDMVIFDETINLAEIHHISLNLGLFGTFTRNPKNIAVLQRPSGDSTLTADDPKSRGMVTILFTFYPKGRNKLFPFDQRNPMERLGFVVGTGISSKLAENFFGGISYDLARGVALSGGLHYARVNYVVDHPDFDFGKDKFTGSLDNRVKMRWDLKGYVGLTLDFGLLDLLLKRGGGTL